MLVLFVGIGIADTGGGTTALERTVGENDVEGKRWYCVWRCLWEGMRKGYGRYREGYGRYRGESSKKGEGFADTEES